MYTKEEIKNIIGDKIKVDHKLREQPGKNDEKIYVDFRIKDFKYKKLSKTEFEIDYIYVLSVEDDKTHYPENPPAEYPYRKLIVVNDIKEIIHEEDFISNGKEPGKFPADQKWESAKEHILEYLEKILDKFEFEFGDNRAPFKYPPEFYQMLSADSANEYYCVVKTNLDDNHTIIVNDFDSTKLHGKLKKSLIKSYPEIKHHLLL